MESLPEGLVIDVDAAAAAQRKVDGAAQTPSSSSSSKGTTAAQAETEPAASSSSSAPLRTINRNRFGALAGNGVPPDGIIHSTRAEWMKRQRELASAEDGAGSRSVTEGQQHTPTPTLPTPSDRTQDPLQQQPQPQPQQAQTSPQQQQQQRQVALLTIQLKFYDGIIAGLACCVGVLLFRVIALA